MEPAVGGRMVADIQLVEGGEAVVREIGAELFEHCKQGLQGHLRCREVLGSALPYGYIEPQAMQLEGGVKLDPGCTLLVVIS